MSDFLAAVRLAVKQYLKQVKLPTKGIVTNYDPKTHKAKVVLQPSQLPTGWLQVATLGTGEGLGLTMGLERGQEVLVVFESGDINSGLIVGPLYNGKELPVNTNSGEFKLVHKSGSYVKFFNDGSIEINAIGGLKVFTPDLTLAVGGMTTSVAGLSLSNITTAQSFGPVSIPGGPVFDPDIHAAASVPTPDV